MPGTGGHGPPDGRRQRADAPLCRLLFRSAGGQEGHEGHCDRRHRQLSAHARHPGAPEGVAHLATPHPTPGRHQRAAIDQRCRRLRWSQTAGDLCAQATPSQEDFLLQFLDAQLAHREVSPRGQLLTRAGFPAHTIPMGPDMRQACQRRHPDRLKDRYACHPCHVTFDQVMGASGAPAKRRNGAVYEVVGLRLKASTVPLVIPTLCTKGPCVASSRPSSAGYGEMPASPPGLAVLTPSPSYRSSHQRPCRFLTTDMN